MDSQTWDSLYETSREKHREYVDRGLDDSCATTPTLNSFVPDTKSPVHQSEDKSIMKHPKNELKGSKNNTVQALPVQNSPDMILKLPGAVSVDDHEGVLSDIDHNRTYKKLVMEDYSNQLGKRTKKGKRKAGKDNRFKCGAIEKCASCEEHVAKIDELEKEQEKSEEKKQAMKNSCDDLQRQLDNQQKELDDYQEKYNDQQKQLDDYRGKCNDLKKQCSDQQRQLNKSQEEVKLLENGCTSCEERTQQEMRTLNEKIKVLIEQNENFTSELNMAEHRFEKELNACKEKSDGEKKELIETMNVQLNEEKKAHNATKVDLEAKCKSLEENLHCERQERTTMVDRMNNLDKENNSQAEQILKAKKQEDSWKQTIAVLDEKVLGLMESNEELTHEKNYQLKSKQDLADKLNACKEKSHREKEEVIATMNAEVEQRKKTIKSLGKKNANLQKINEDMASGIDELEDQIEVLRLQLNEVSTRANNLLIHNGSLQRIVNDLGASLQAFEGREQDVQDFRDQFRRIIDGLQHGQPDNPGHLQFRNGRVGIPALSLSDTVSDVSDAGYPALSLSDAVSVGSDVGNPALSLSVTVSVGSDVDVPR